MANIMLSVLTVFFFHVVRLQEQQATHLSHLLNMACWTRTWLNLVLVWVKVFCRTCSKFSYLWKNFSWEVGHQWAAFKAFVLEAAARSCGQKIINACCWRLPLEVFFGGYVQLVADPELDPEHISSTFGSPRRNWKTYRYIGYMDYSV